jgi:SAM-dependent methyltransferase
MKAHEYGATMLAMDLSPAVDATYAKARSIDGIDVVQGDIFNPPFVPGTFEFVYSIGVIHHTPDPPRAFRSLVPLVKPGGTIACLVYASGRPIALRLLGSIRSLTTRLPLPATKGLSWLAAAIDRYGPIALLRLARRFGASDAMLAKVFPEHVRIYADESFDTIYTDWLDRLSYPYVHYYDRDDMQEWLDRSRLEHTVVTELGTHGVVGVGRTPEEAPAVRTPA